MLRIRRLSPRRGADRTRDVLLVVVLVAAVATAWFGWSWWSAAHDDALARARARETVLDVAGDAVRTLNTVDYRTAEQDIAAWKAVTAGNFGRELADSADDQVKQVKKAKTVAKASVREIAVTRLRPRKGLAHVMAVLDVSVHGKKQNEQHRHSMLQLELTETAKGWKISAVQAAS